MLGLMLTAGHIESHVARIERDEISLDRDTYAALEACCRVWTADKPQQAFVQRLRRDLETRKEVPPELRKLWVKAKKTATPAATSAAPVTPAAPVKK